MERAHRTERDFDPAADRRRGATLDDPIQRLQQTAGNAAVARLLAPADVQRLAEPTDSATADVAEPATANVAEPATADPAAGASDRPMIRYGSVGPSVGEAQGRLNAAGAAPPLAIDQIFGTLTRAATRVFQTSRGLNPDAIIGPLTWAELLNTPVPPPIGPTLFALGDEGSDIGLLEQRLNAAGMAQPPLPIDATFDLGVMLAVMRLQLEVMGRIPTGAVDQATWDALEVLAPGGVVDAGGNMTHVDSGTADAHGVQNAGTSLHQIVGPGGLMNGPAVEEFQQKLNIVRLGAGLPPIAEDGFWGSETSTATAAYQTSVGITPADGNGTLATWARLDVDAPATTVGYVERQWSQQQGGQTTGMSGAGASKYSWRIAGNQILVSSKVDFRNNPPASSWFGHVTAAWNKYKAVSDSGDEVMIDFELVAGSGADSKVVDVRTGTGRANAGRWFLGDPNAANTIPHEYGHLIGLRDEYQVHPGDYREITGHEPPVGEADGPTDGSTPRVIAQEVQAAMVARDSQAASDATRGRGIVMGAFAQRVVQEYQSLPTVTCPARPAPGPLPAYTTTGNDIAVDLFNALPGTTATDSSNRYETIQVLTYSSGSMMGDPGRVTDPHDHGVRPRHVQEFCDLVAAARGGTWTVVER